MARLQGLQRQLPSQRRSLVHRMLIFDRAMYPFIQESIKIF